MSDIVDFGNRAQFDEFSTPWSAIGLPCGSVGQGDVAVRITLQGSIVAFHRLGASGHQEGE